MSDASRQDEDVRPGFGEGFDWRAGQTWAVFLGSALACGLMVSASILGVDVLYLGVPTAPVANSDLLIGILIVVVVVGSPLILLRWLLIRGHQEGMRTEDAFRDLKQFETWQDFWLHFLWCIVLAAPQLTMHFGFFRAPPEVVMISVWAYVVAAAFSRFLLPVAMQRWA